MEKKTMIIGALGITAIGYYLYKTKHSDVSSHKLSGINVSINPDQVIDAGMAFVDANPYVKEKVADTLKGIINGYLSK